MRKGERGSAASPGHPLTMSKRLRLPLLGLASCLPVSLLLISSIHAAAPAPRVGVAATTAPPCAATLSCDGDGPIVALGDSMTYGYGQGVTAAAYGPAPAGSYPWDLERLLGVPVINAGMSGDTARTAMQPPTRAGRFRPPSLRIPQLLGLHPRLVIVGFGSAEAAYGVPLARAGADLDALLTALDGVPTVIVGSHVDCSAITVCVAPQPVEFTSAWDRELGALARRHGSGLVTDVLQGLAAAGEMTDSLHPNARGYAVVASRIAVAVRQRLGGRADLLSGGAGSRGD